MKRNHLKQLLCCWVFGVLCFFLDFSPAKSQTLLESNTFNDKPGSGETGVSLPNSLIGSLQGDDQDYWDIPNGTIGTFQVFDMFNVNFLYGSLNLELRSYSNSARTEGEVIRILAESDTFSLTANRFYSLRMSSNSESPGINIPTAVSTYQDLRSLLVSIENEIQGIENVIPSDAFFLRFLLNNLQAFLAFQLDNLPNTDDDLPENIAALINLVLSLDVVSDLIADFYSVTLVQAASNVGSLLPVVWLDFHAEAKNNQVELTWLTASEHNNQGFAVEYSQDAKKWQEVGFVEGRGTSTVVSPYTFTHATPNPGYNYYRLKQEDFNGDFEYSSIQEVVMTHTSLTSTFLAYPNPVSEFLYVDSQIGQILLRDLNGKLLYTQQVNGWGNQFSVKEFPRGVYLLEFVPKTGERETLRIQVN